MGGSKAPPTSSTTYTSNLPEYARPYFERLMDRTEAESNRQYTPYQGQRVAGFTGDQQQAFGITRDLANRGTPDLDVARDAAGAGTMAGLQNAGFQNNTIGTRMFDGSAANQYMSPYMNAVVQQQKDAAVRDFSEGQGARNQQAIASGAFGGYRSAIAQGVAERGLQNRLAEIQARGTQSAFENAQQQFERDRTAGFNVDSANEANRRAAAGVRLAGAQAGIQGAEAFRGLGATDQGLTLQRATALGQAGDRQQALEQRGFDIAYDDFVNQRDFDRNQLLFYGSMLRGMPVNPQQEVRQYSNPNPLSQMAGLGIAGLGAYRMMG